MIAVEKPATDWLWRRLVAAALLLVMSFSVLLLMRRLSGAFQPLGGMSLVAVMLGLVACGAVLRLGGVAVHRSDWRSSGWASQLLSSFCLLLVGGALTIPGSPPWALVLLWAGILAAETAWWGCFLWRSPRVSRPIALRRFRPRGRVPEDVARDVTRAQRDMSDRIGALSDVTQQLTRSLEHDGGETLHGLVRAEFAPGERLRQVHIAICPPMAAAPELRAVLVDRPAATVKVAQRETFGVRLEVRLAAAVQQTERVTIEFQAHCPAGSGLPAGPGETRRARDE
jgi:hypothetical protein